MAPSTGRLATEGGNLRLDCHYKNSRDQAGRYRSSRFYSGFNRGSVLGVLGARAAFASAVAATGLVCRRGGARRRCLRCVFSAGADAVGCRQHLGVVTLAVEYLLPDLVVQLQQQQKRAGKREGWARGRMVGGCWCMARGACCRPTSTTGSTRGESPRQAAASAAGSRSAAGCRPRQSARQPACSQPASQPAGQAVSCPPVATAWP